MTPLREQLRAGREAHQSARYPGDLAADVLRDEPGAVRSPRLMLVPLLVSGLAAMLVAAVVAKLPETGLNVPGPILINPYPRADLDLVASAEDEVPAEEIALTLPGLPAMPEGIELILDETEVSLGAAPGLPSFSWSAESFVEASVEPADAFESEDLPETPY